MLDNKLVQKLKDAGFPQEGRGTRWEKISSDPFDLEKGEYIPTLSELIEELEKKEDFFGLLKYANAWKAIRYPTSMGENEKDNNWATGQTKEEAVAKLYLKLHEKDKGQISNQNKVI